MIRPELLIATLAIACEPARPLPTPPLPVPIEAPREAPAIDLDLDSGYAYSPVGRRDPFLGFDVDPESPPAVGVQRWDLDQLRLVAVVRNGRAHAMVVDPEGLGYTLSIGSMIGNRWGRVSAIRRGVVIVREDGVDSRGAKISVERELRLGAMHG